MEHWTINKDIIIQVLFSVMHTHTYRIYGLDLDFF